MFFELWTHTVLEKFLFLAIFSTVYSFFFFYICNFRKCVKILVHIWLNIYIRNQKFSSVVIQWNCMTGAEGSGPVVMCLELSAVTQEKSLLCTGCLRRKLRTLWQRSNTSSTRNSSAKTSSVWSGMMERSFCILVSCESARRENSSVYQNTTNTKHTAHSQLLS